MCAASIPCSPLSNTCSPRCITTGRSPIVCTTSSRTAMSPCRPASSTWCAAILARAAWRLPRTPSRASATWCSSPRLTVWVKPWCRAPSTPDEFYVHKATLTAGRPAILRRNLGTKAIKMIYSDDRAHGRATRTVDVAEAERLRFCLTAHKYRIWPARR